MDKEYEITVTKDPDALDVFHVIVNERNKKAWFRVTLGDAYHQALSGGAVTKEKLIEESFEFLLTREPKESILKEFDLTEIARYFPAYEKEIAKHLADR